MEDGKHSPSDLIHAAVDREVTIRVTDKQGQVSERTAIIDLYDSTPPLVPQQTVEMSAILGQPLPLTAEAIDAESPSLIYHWDLDPQTDSDSDGIMDNDIDASGSTITQNQRKGHTKLFALVNEAGASTKVTT